MPSPASSPTPWPLGAPECPWPDHPRPVPATIHGLCQECHDVCVQPRNQTCEICFADPHVVRSNPDLEALEDHLDNIYRGQFP